MMRKLKLGESRLLAVLLTFAVLVALIVSVVEIDRRYHAHYDASIEGSLDQIARYNRVAATRKSYEDAIRAVKARGGERFYLKSSTPALAAADVQQVVQTIVEANDLRVESTQIAPFKDEGGLRKISVNLRLRGKLSGIQHMLYVLETGQPYLFVDNLVIQSLVRPNYDPAPAIEPDVIVQIELSGFAMLKK